MDDDKKARSAKKESFIVASRMKQFCKANEFSAGHDLQDALSEKVERLLTEAFARVRANGRKVVKGHDA